ncbi:OmpW family outer membrane protein [Paraburkholderia flagellata]|uniref:OmpW family outer membrane protein n=1 Tax=Paraburkholderia flagellata TaxID=2883241 RepID=UPI003570EDA0
MSGTGAISRLEELGAARAWSPALQAQYHFSEPNSCLRPYLGAGVAYVLVRQCRMSQPFAIGQMLYSPSLGARLEGLASVSMSCRSRRSSTRAQRCAQQCGRQLCLFIFTLAA